MAQQLLPEDEQQLLPEDDADAAFSTWIGSVADEVQKRGYAVRDDSQLYSHVDPSLAR